MAKKIKTFEDLTKELNEKYGQGTIMTGEEENTEVESISTGSLLIDKASRCGGIPLGYVVEFQGDQSSGKSTTALEIIAQFQKAGKRCVLADFEQSWSKPYSETIGVNSKELIILTPETMEDGYQQILELVESGHVSLIVIDSISAMIPKKKLEGDISDAFVALEARIHSLALLKLKKALKDNKCTLLAISQYRSNVGQMMGETKITTGGNSYKFYSDMRTKFSKISTKKEEGYFVCKVEFIKNKVAPPHGICETFISMEGEGFDSIRELVTIAQEKGIIKRAGAWYSYGEDKIGQGFDSVKSLLMDNPELEEEIRQKINQ